MVVVAKPLEGIVSVPREPGDLGRDAQLYTLGPVRQGFTQ